MGYPSDFEAEAAWEYKDYLKWMVEWVPRPRKNQALFMNHSKSKQNN